MALKILSAEEPITVENITLVIYGDPGAGKTTLAFSAEKPLLFDFDKGAHRALGRKDTVRVNTWADVAGLTAADLAPFSTIVVDTAGRLLDALSADIIANDAKMAKAGVLSQQGWGKLKQRFLAWTKLIHQSGKDVVLIAHGTEKMDGEEVKARLDVQGGSKDEILKSADAIGRVFVKSGKRVLSFDPTESAFGKNPGQFDLLDIPTPITPTFLADLIVETKAQMNQQTEAMQEAARVQQGWVEAFALLETADDFNSKLPALKEQTPAIKRLFMQAADKRGLVFDSKAATFSAKSAEAA